MNNHLLASLTDTLQQVSALEEREEHLQKLLGEIWRTLVELREVLGNDLKYTTKLHVTPSGNPSTKSVAAVINNLLLHIDQFEKGTYR